MIEQLKSLIANGWEYSIRAEIDKPISVSIWRAEWVTSNLYAARPCPTFHGDDLERVIGMAYEYMLGVI
jgi:hypothetical protein